MRCLNTFYNNWLYYCITFISSRTVYNTTPDWTNVIFRQWGRVVRGVVWRISYPWVTSLLKILILVFQFYSIQYSYYKHVEKVTELEYISFSVLTLILSDSTPLFLNENLWRLSIFRIICWLPRLTLWPLVVETSLIWKFIPFILFKFIKLKN